MDELGASLEFVPFLIFIAAVFILFRVSSNRKRRGGKIRHPSGPARMRRTSMAEGGDTSETENNRARSANSAHRPNVSAESDVRDLPEFQVKHVIDGDTVVVSNSWRDVRVRLDAIDCPEDDQHWGETARYGLIKLIGGREIRLEEHGKDRYGRTLATIYVAPRSQSGWINVNERMVTLGHAWVMRRFYGHLPNHRRVKLNRLERWAKSKNIGLWRSPNPVPPWKWRSGREALPPEDTD